MKYLILLLLSFNTLAYDCNSPKEEILKASDVEYNRYTEVIIDTICDKQYSPDLQVLLENKNVTLKDFTKVNKLLKGTK